MLINGKCPNILILMNDEERFPPPYENDEARDWRLEHSPTRLEIASRGLEFRRHYTGATACAPARATLFTGQYPSLHGVSQTPGMAKSSADPAMFWLDPGTVPTLGDYMRAGGYQTHYKGKWHASDADIMVPGSVNGLLSNDSKGLPFPEKLKRYLAADRLDGYGFHGWIGPEPHGALTNNCGTVRDPGFASQAAQVIERLDEMAATGEDDRPWLLVSSFVNPHDIVFSGPLLRAQGWFQLFYDIKQNYPEMLPNILPPPTAHECLQTKPRVQQDYVLQYPRMYMPQPANETYFQFYYWLMAEVDKHFGTVYEALKQSSFFDNTIVLLTADHGDLLGSHGGMQQKWHNAYEETIHVPLVVSNPVLFGGNPGTTEILTSHLDLLPTVLGLAGVDVEQAREAVGVTHTEAQALVGRDLSGLIQKASEGANLDAEENEVVYFMTQDQVSLGLQQFNATGAAYRAIIQPNNVETVVTRLRGEDGRLTLYKCSRYFDNPRFSSGVGNPDLPYTAQASESPVPDEWECYNLDADPNEERNLMSPLCHEALSPKLSRQLKECLAEQSVTKRKLPQNNNRMPDLNDVSPVY